MPSKGEFSRFHSHFSLTMWLLQSMTQLQGMLNDCFIEHVPAFSVQYTFMIEFSMYKSWCDKINRTLKCLPDLPDWQDPSRTCSVAGSFSPWWQHCFWGFGYFIQLVRKFSPETEAKRIWNMAVTKCYKLWHCSNDCQTEIFGMASVLSFNFLNT